MRCLARAGQRVYACLPTLFLAGALTLSAAANVTGQLVSLDADLPRVMVFLDEDGEAATQQVSAFLREAGFTVIDPAFARTASERELASRAVAGDDAAATALGRDLGAQILVLGSVPSEDRASPADERLRVGTAHLSLRALRLDRPRIVSDQQADARGLDATGLAARRKAVGGAVEQALYRTSFVGDLLIDWDERPWQDDAYWEPAPGSIGAQVALPDPPASIPVPGSPMQPGVDASTSPPGRPSPAGGASSPPRIAILESEAYPRSREGTRGIDIVGVQDRVARVRGVVTDPAATVLVAGHEVGVQPLGADEVRRLGLGNAGGSFEAQVPLGFDDRTVRVEASGASGRTQVDVTPEIGQRWAVVIGISSYADDRIPQLRYADDDARAMYDFLRSSEGGSVPEENMRLLLDGDATAAAVRDALFVFLQRAAPEDLVTVYLASHGSPDPTRAANLYILTHDTDLDRMAATAFPMWDVKTALRRQIAAERVVVIADACRSAGTLADDANPVAGAFSTLFSPSRRVTLSAAGLNEVSFEDARWGGGHGVFTHTLLTGLRGEGDADGDGVVTFREAVAFVEARVPDATGGEQNPEWSGLGDLPLSRLGAGSKP